MGKKRFSKGSRRSKKEIIDIEINSLLDILVIILVFLIKSYNSSSVTINIPKDIKAPISKSLTRVNEAILIHMNKDMRIWVEDKLVDDLSDADPSKFSNNSTEIVALHNELLLRKESLNNVAKQATGVEEYKGLVNLIMDKRVSYKYIKLIMNTAMSAGYKEFKFIVIGKE